MAQFGDLCAQHMELSVKFLAVCRPRPGIKPQGHEQPKNRRQKKSEDIHAIDTADQSAEIPPLENTNTPHMLDTPQLYFNSLYINSVSKNDTQALLQLQVDSDEVTTPLLCKINTGAEGNVIPVDIYRRLCLQSSYSPEGAPLGLQRLLPSGGTPCCTRTSVSSPCHAMYACPYVAIFNPCLFTFDLNFFTFKFKLHV